MLSMLHCRNHGKFCTFFTAGETLGAERQRLGAKCHPQRLCSTFCTVLMETPWKETLRHDACDSSAWGPQPGRSSAHLAHPICTRPPSYGHTVFKMQISQSVLGPVSLLWERLLLWDGKTEDANLKAETKGSLATGGHYRDTREEKGPEQQIPSETHWKLLQ